MPELIIEKYGQTGVLCLSNPERRNAISVEMWKDFPQKIQQLQEDPDVRVVVLQGSGTEAFAAGADISQFEQHRNNADQSQEYHCLTQTAFDAIRNLDKPTIAKIHGFCMGGGLLVALCCDFRIAAENASFSIPASKLGIGYAHENVQQMVDVVGAVQAREILFLARTYSASEALQKNLIHRLVSSDTLALEVQNWCDLLGKRAPLTLKAMKRSIHHCTQSPHSIPSDVMNALQQCTESQDYQEGYRAFLEKRIPQFIGQ